MLTLTLGAQLELGDQAGGAELLLGAQTDCAEVEVAMALEGVHQVLVHSGLGLAPAMEATVAMRTAVEKDILDSGEAKRSSCDG